MTSACAWKLRARARPAIGYAANELEDVGDRLGVGGTAGLLGLVDAAGCFALLLLVTDASDDTQMTRDSIGRG